MEHSIAHTITQNVITFESTHPVPSNLLRLTRFLTQLLLVRFGCYNSNCEENICVRWYRYYAITCNTNSQPASQSLRLAGASRRLKQLWPIVLSTYFRKKKLFRNRLLLLDVRQGWGFFRWLAVWTKKNERNRLTFFV